MLGEASAGSELLMVPNKLIYQEKLWIYWLAWGPELLDSHELWVISVTSTHHSWLVTDPSPGTNQDLRVRGFNELRSYVSSGRLLLHMLHKLEEKPLNHGKHCRLKIRKTVTTPPAGRRLQGRLWTLLNTNYGSHTRLLGYCRGLKRFLDM